MFQYQLRQAFQMFQSESEWIYPEDFILSHQLILFSFAN